MRLLYSALSLLALSADPGFAASCEKQIKRLFDGGVMDPFERGPREEVVVEVHPDGTQNPMQIVRWESPTKVITQMNGMHILQYGTGMYIGESWEGPWAKQQELSFDPEEQARSTSRSYTDNMSNADCGKVDGLKTYAFHYQAGSKQGESWWEGDLILFIGDNGLQRMEERNSAASWAPEPKASTMITTVTQRPDFGITPPQE